MTQRQAEEIAFNWHYEGEYSFYNMEADQDDLEEFLNPEARGDSTFAVTKGQDLFAFLSVSQKGKTVDIGLGMKPNITGKGNGLAFLKAAIDFIKREYEPWKITLSVATFNQRAIKVYKKFGFKEVDKFMQQTNGSTFEFIKMEYV